MKQKMLALLVLGVSLLLIAAQCSISNMRPIAVLTADRTSGMSPLAVGFDASGSYDPDGVIVSYTWVFGDGTSGMGPTATHTFITNTDRTYTVTLTVTDDGGRTSSSSVSISVVVGSESSTGRPTAYVWYEWPEPPVHPDLSGFFNVDVELTIQTAAPPGYGLFWAHQFMFKEQVDDPNAQPGGYIGLQQGSGWASGAGKIAIFSIWDALDAEAGPGFSCSPFGGEGEGWSCRGQYGWMTGRKYRLRVWVLGTQMTAVDGVVCECQWFGAWVMDITTGIETYIGRILVPVPSKWQWIYSSVVWGAEYFTLAPDGYCGDAPHATAIFENPTADNGAFEPSHATVMYSTCPNSNVTQVSSLGALLETGGSTQRTTPELSKLW